MLDPDVRDGIRDLTVGSDIFVLTWLHRSRRDKLPPPFPGMTRPGPSEACSALARRPGPTRSDYRVSILAVETRTGCRFIP